MIKKIGSKSPRPRKATAVQPTRTVGSSKIGSIDQVEQAAKKQRAARTRSATRRMTPEERDELFRIVHEEADKIFGEQGMPETKRASVETAVKMAIDASIVDEDEEEEGG